MPSPDPAERLLAVLLAARAELLDAAKVDEACAAAAADPEVPAAEWLETRGWIASADREILERLVGKKLAKHGQDPGAALRALPALGRAAGALATVDTPVLRQTLDLDAPELAGHVLVQTLERGDLPRERYTLNRLHAEGGLGQVWLARDAQIGREVAFKEIRPTQTGNPSVWARFLREARITGQLEHPGIVPVYELSAREKSAPFYTMRFVRGRTLSEASAAYQDKLRLGHATALDLRELLDAFVGVANAVAYAHSRGVIHRDLKGANVILGDFGEVVVLDWGLAKVVHEPAAEFQPAGVNAPPSAHAPSGDEGPASRTLHGQLLGTPAYMPPEQADGRLDEVDSRSDVWGLGAILYEILTGEPPFSGSSIEETLRRVREEPPLPPRQRSSAAAPALEAICLKALAKSPDERYPSAGALSREVQRFLADEPVEAYPEPLPKRAGRWARRHKAWVAGAAALLLTAVVGLSAGTILLRQKQTEVESQRDRAEANFRLARGAVDSYLTRVADSSELRAHGLEHLRAKLLRTAQEFYEKFTQERGDDPELRGELGVAQHRLGEIHRELGEMDAGQQAYEAGIAILEGLSRSHPGESRYLENVLQMNNGLAILFMDTGRHAESEAAYRRGLDLAERLIAQGHPGDAARVELANLHDNLANLYDRTGRGAEGEELHERGLALREALLRERPDDTDRMSAVVKSHVNFANLYSTTGRSAEAIPHLEVATRVGEQLVARHPNVADYRNSLAASWDNLGGALILTDRLDQAEAPYRRALELKDALVHDHPAVLEYRLLLASTSTNLGELACRRNRPAEGLPWFDRAIGQLNGVLEREPRHAIGRYYLSYTHSWRAMALESLGRGAEALRDWERAIAFDDRGDQELRRRRKLAARGAP